MYVKLTPPPDYYFLEKIYNYSNIVNAQRALQFVLSEDEALSKHLIVNFK